MSTYKILATSVVFILLQGCSMLENPFSSMGSSNYNNGFYDEEHIENNPRQASSRNQVEDETPVQMTTKDTQLHALKPESAPVKNNSKNVLLPIAGDLE